MDNLSTNTAPSEQPQQASPAVENNVPTELGENVQPSASGSDAEPALISLLDLPKSVDPDQKEQAVMYLQDAGILDKEGLPKPMQAEADDDWPVRMKAQVRLRTMAEAGLRPAYVDQNREIHPTNVNQLEKSLLANGAKVFNEPAKVAWAPKVLIEGLKLVTFDGQEVTLETEDVDKYFVILDGQHRCVCCCEHPEFDLWCEFADYKGSTMSYIGTLNNLRTSWNCKDIHHSVIAKYEDGVNVLVEIKKFADHFGVTYKTAELAITRKFDQFKRAELNAMQLGLKEPTAKYVSDPHLVEAGWNIMNSILLSVKDPQDIKVFKKFEIWVAIYNIKRYRTKEAQQADFEKNIATFMGNLKPEQVEEIISLIKDRNLETLKVYLHKEYCDFVEKHKADIKTLRSENAENVKVKKDSETKTPTTVTRLKIGTPADILANRQAIALKKASKSSKKTKKSAAPTTQDAPVIADPAANDENDLKVTA